MPANRTLASRRLRLATVVGVASGLVALCLTGSGLLLPGASPATTWRVIGAVLAVGAAGALLRMEGPSRSATGLATLSVVALGLCVITAPASDVTTPWESVPDTLGPTGDEGGEAGGRDVLIEPGAGGGSVPRGTLVLPPGADVVIDHGKVVLELPDGGRIVIGDATVESTRPGMPPSGTSVAVVNGTVSRGDGGALGPEVGLGGVTIERSDGSRAAVGGGSLIEVPPPLDSEDPGATRHRDALLAVLLGCFAVLAFAPPIVRFSERTGVSIVASAGDDEPEDETRSAAPTVEQGLADVLRSMLADPDPRTSVIGAYARLLTALAEAGFPRRDEEGPHEHLWRSLGPLGVRRQPVHELAELFVRARFTPRPVTEGDRQSAIAALADTVADLRLQASDVREAAASVGVSG